MTSDAAAQEHEPNLASERFYAGAIRRIVRALIVFAFVLVVPVGYKFGIPSAIGFAAGALVSWLNFHFLARGVDGLGRPYCKRSVARERCGRHCALSPSLSVGWRDRLCYICWLSFGVSGIPVRALPARSSHAH